ncbi:MAG: aminotransferase class I/II-fold pyridoxal phosphate-dependent enzyme [Eubacteriales bacterium]|nr:aminotransferase class I/II-fold pyridoxal phosphate-dependent enzyme [Eubacteriales bacterium]
MTSKYNYDQLLSSEVKSLKPSAIRHFFDLANRMKGEIISLSIGEPDFVTPWLLREAGILAIEDGYTHYSPNRGFHDLLEELAQYLAERFEAPYRPEDELLLTVGGSEAIDLALRALINPGDEVVIPEPAYVAYEACTHLSGAQIRHLALSADDEFRLTAEKLRTVMNENTKVVLTGFPNNPTGATMSRHDWLQVAELLDDFPNCILISDELYAELSYGECHVSPASIERLRNRCIMIGGFSKAFAMTGWRLGYAAGPDPLISAMGKIHQYMIMSAPTLSQKVALAALRAPRNSNGEIELLVEMRDAYDARRRFILKRLSEIGLPCFEPRGAFYVFPSIAEFGLSSNQFCERLLEEKYLAVVPGSAFGPSGESYVRISYAASMAQIRTAMERLEDFVSTLRTASKS